MPSRRHGSVPPDIAPSPSAPPARARRALSDALRCRPISLPRLPQTHHHHLWDAWDLAAEACLAQLPQLLAPGAGPRASFRFSSFFTEQLTAFETWLHFGTRESRARTP